MVFSQAGGDWKTRRPSARWNKERLLKPEYNFKGAKGGAVAPVPRSKTRITIRIDDAVLEWFRDQSIAQAEATTKL